MKRLALTIIIAAVVLLEGCATPASRQAMTVQPDIAVVQPNEKLKGQIEVVSVSGGKGTNPLWTSQVDNSGFMTALSDSIAIAGYQAPAGQSAKYKLSAQLQSLDQPLFGMTFNVKSSVTYVLESGEGANQVRREFPIIATGTATTSDAFVGVERLRIANERSIAENIKELLQQLRDF